MELQLKGMQELAKETSQIKKLSLWAYQGNKASYPTSADQDSTSMQFLILWFALWPNLPTNQEQLTHSH
jgi:hypothetical protein